MQTDRFWALIDQARVDAGAAADEAVRGVDAEVDDPERDYWSLDDVDIEAFNASPGEGGSLDADATEHRDEELDDKNNEDEEEEDDLTDPVAVALFDLLAQLPAAQIAAFDTTFEDLRNLADREDIAAAAVLIEHGLRSDENFEDFRAGLVALGRQAFEAALDNPDSLATHPLVREIAAAHDPRYLGREDLLYVASHAYAAVTGEEELTFYEYAESVRDPEAQPVYPAEAEEWDLTDEAETRRRLPGLSDLFYDRSMRIREKALQTLGLQE